MRIILVSTNAGTAMGGEAIKAWQFFAYLLDHGFDVCLLTHARCREELSEHFDPARLIFVEDDRVQKLLWQSRVLARLVTPYFHRVAARLCQRFDPADTLIHYVCPISPAIQRFPPRGFRYVAGPLSGNVFYPPAFRARAEVSARIREAVYPMTQRIAGIVSGDKRRADRILVSGYERTRTALRWAGVRDAQMLDVVDSGISDDIVTADRITHRGRNGDFVWIGRFIDLKGAFLVLQALALCAPDIRVTFYGEGPVRAAMQALAHTLGVADRAHFAGWLPHEQYVETMARFRGFVFPTLSESNGIVMQEAMAIGLPVVTLRWGGPTGLADDSQAVFIEPTGEREVVEALAAAMTRLAEDDAFAERLSQAGRAKAQAAFSWDRVAASWTAVYPPAALPQEQARKKRD